MSRIVVLGAQGQIGWELVRALQPQGEVLGLTRDEADLERPAQLREVLRRAAPQVIFNAAGYTNVDAAETDAARAFAVNQDAVALLADEAAVVETAVAAAYERSGNLGLALRHYTKLDAIFKSFAEDAADFLGYCLRKGPLRALVDTLAMTETLRRPPLSPTRNG
jgi:NAD(P)-dependent dehydrogenase (short-subunit alcohol dehydrogenase family)